MTLKHATLIAFLLALAGQASADAGDLATYIIQPGDNLERIAQRYLSGKSGVQALQSANKLNGKALLQPGAALLIPRELLTFQPVKAVVTESNCSISGSRNGAPLRYRVGSVINEGDELSIDKNCRASLLLDDGSQVRLLSAATVRLERLRRNALEEKPEVRLKVMNGKAEAEVAHREDGRANFRMSTPTAMAGVRGTILRVGYDAEQGRSAIEVDQGLVAASSLKTPGTTPALLAADTGQGFDAKGRPGPVEHLPPPPAGWHAGAQDEGAVAVAVDQAGAYHYRRSIDLFFSDFEEAQAKTPPALAKESLSRTAVFLESSSLTASGLEGRSAVAGVCRSAAGCDLYVNGAPVQMRRFRLLSHTGEQAASVIVDKASFDKGASFVVSGLPAGRYEWQAELQIQPERAVSIGGTFNLFAVN